MRLLVLVAFASIAVAQPAFAKQKKPVRPPPETSAQSAAAMGEAARYLDAIKRLDDDPAGPRLNAVVAINPDAVRQAGEQATKGVLKGRTVLVKDNIETREFPTTAGSLALADNRTGRDAPVVARVRAEGGVVLGKTNLSEWANIRGSSSSSGWSAVGGQTKNPHAIDRSPCGSSSGSGAAIAAGMAWGAIGTETDGSITCPASANGIVGFKPTVGLVSRTWIVPISASQDTAGPMTRSVADAALLLTAMQIFISLQDGKDDAKFRATQTAQIERMATALEMAAQALGSNEPTRANQVGQSTQEGTRSQAGTKNRKDRRAEAAQNRRK